MTENKMPDKIYVVASYDEWRNGKWVPHYTAREQWEGDAQEYIRADLVPTYNLRQPSYLKQVPTRTAYNSEPTVTNTVLCQDCGKPMEKVSELQNACFDLECIKNTTTKQIRVSDEASASENYCVSDTAKREAWEALDKLYAIVSRNEFDDFDFGTGLYCRNKIRAALQTPSYEALRKSHAELLEALERSRTVIQKFVDCGLGGMDAALALDEINLIFMQLDEKLQEGKL